MLTILCKEPTVTVCEHQTKLGLKTNVRQVHLKESVFPNQINNNVSKKDNSEWQ
jgi:hypothetical protein